MPLTERAEPSGLDPGAPDGRPGGMLGAWGGDPARCRQAEQARRYVYVKLAVVVPRPAPVK